MIARCAIMTVTFLVASLGIAESAAQRHPPQHKRIVHSPQYRPPYAAIVVDANSGKVLHESDADDPRHPASLTKIMTLYLLFEQLDAGKLKLETPLQVSIRAAHQHPTKLGLKSNQTIKVEDAIKGLVTKSANDAAVVISEAVGGTEGTFADLMTQKARALGMASTTYVNASGLPDEKQITTARDQALLARAIQARFPGYYRFFATRSFRYNGVVMHNDNNLLAQVKGTDGIKTGYTKASGYNLVSSVRRDGKHIVAVVLGGTSNAVRDARMRELIENYIVYASSEQTTPMIMESANQHGAPDKTSNTIGLETSPPDPRAIVALTNIAAEARASILVAQPSRRPGRTSKARAQVSGKAQRSKPAALTKRPPNRAPQPTSPTAGLIPRQRPPITPVAESLVERVGEFVLSPAPALAEQPSPPVEPQQQSQQEETQRIAPGNMGKEEPSSHAETAKSQDGAVLVNGALAVHGAAIATSTVPAKFSEKNSANDKLITLAYTFKLLSVEDRGAIYRTLNGRLCGSAPKAEIGTKLPLAIELRAVPDELIVGVPQIKGYQYTVAGNEILLVSPLTRVVVAVFSDNSSGATLIDK